MPSRKHNVINFSNHSFIYNQWWVAYTYCRLEIEISTHLFKALFALRVYAIYNKNIMILEIALIFIILRFVLDIWVSDLVAGPVI